MSCYNGIMVNTRRQTFRCLRCNFIWLQSVTDEAPRPQVCPSCNSQEWDKSKKAAPRK